MGKDQLISMIHFLVKREDERAQENQDLKDMVKELRDTHKQDVKTQTNLMKSIDRLTSQVADLTTQNKTLQQKVNVAERTLRPMTVERKRSSSAGLLPKGRKNSLTFGSHAGAKVSVIYHTFIETCKMCGVSTLENFKEFFKAIMRGRTDYENMLPMTIGLNNKV